jgi:hypothetical protein
MAGNGKGKAAEEQGERRAFRVTTRAFIYTLVSDKLLGFLWILIPRVTEVYYARFMGRDPHVFQENLCHGITLCSKLITVNSRDLLPVQSHCRFSHTYKLFSLT